MNSSQKQPPDKSAEVMRRQLRAAQRDWKPWSEAKYPDIDSVVGAAGKLAQPMSSEEMRQIASEDHAQEVLRPTTRPKPATQSHDAQRKARPTTIPGSRRSVPSSQITSHRKRQGRSVRAVQETAGALKSDRPFMGAAEERAAAEEAIVRESIATTSLDQVGEALKETGLSLDELVESGREERASLIEQHYGIRQTDAGVDEDEDGEV